MENSKHSIPVKSIIKDKLKIGLEDCPNCLGLGFWGDDEHKKCQCCNGTGAVTVAMADEIKKVKN